MKRHRIILNGKSAGRDDLRAAVNKVRTQGANLEVRVTWEQSDVERLVAEAIEDQVDVLIAAGGDGTIHQVVDATFRATSRPCFSMGVIPLGTANDFATSCLIPTTMLEAIQLAITGSPVQVDVARCNEEHFLNVASGGIGAEITTSTPPAMKNALGGSAYTLSALVSAHKLKPYSGSVTGPDGEREGAVLVAAVGNGRQAGGGIEVTPKAFINDGLLDLMMIREFGLNELHRVIAEAKDPKSSNQFVYYDQLREFTIKCEQGMPLNLDGEPVRENEYRFSVLPGALSLVLPEDCPLVRR